METRARIKAAMLAALMDEYGGTEEDWLGMRSLDRVARAVELAIRQSPQPEDA